MKQPIKMTPGDDLHLTLLMAPFSLNLVTGQDRQHLLGYGRAAFEAGKSGQCLHQIQEPAPVLAAQFDAGISGNKTPQAVPAEGDPAALEQLANVLESGRRLIQVERKEIANALCALAATPAADAPAWDGKLPERLQRALNELRIDCKTAAVSSLEFEVRSAFEGMHTSLATVKRLNHAAQKRLDSVDAAQPDPFAAAAPVVLPEPDFWVRPSIAAYELPWQVCNGSASAEQAYLAGTVRALLATATGLPAQAVPDEYRYKWHGEKRFASTLDFIPKDGVDIEPLFTHAAPQAQADARDAESDYQRGYRHGYNRRDAEVQGALL